MTELHERLAERVRDWRVAGYRSDHPAIAEILEYAVEGEEDGRPFPASGWLRFLRAPQLRALAALQVEHPRVSWMFAETRSSPRTGRRQAPRVRVRCV